MLTCLKFVAAAVKKLETLEAMPQLAKLDESPCPAGLVTIRRLGINEVITGIVLGSDGVEVVMIVLFGDDAVRAPLTLAYRLPQELWELRWDTGEVQLPSNDADDETRQRIFSESCGCAYKIAKKYGVTRGNDVVMGDDFAAKIIAEILDYASELDERDRIRA
jgi:hypothetical protein